MFLRCKEYPLYYVAKYRDTIAVFREGNPYPLTPWKAYRTEVVYRLSINGQVKIISLFEFLRLCFKGERSQ